MTDSIGFVLLLQVILIALNAVFACAEIAVISFNDTKLEKLAESGDRRARRLVRLTAQPGRFLSTIQVAITLAGFLGSAFAAENFSGMLVDWLIGLGVTIPASVLESIAVVVITLILSYFTLVFGELVPKQVAMKKTESLALALAGLLSFVSKAFAPIVGLLTLSTNGVLRLLGIDPNAHDDEVSEEEIRMMVDAGSEKGVIDSTEQQFINNVFDFDDLTAGELATHRTEVRALWLEETPEEWDATIRGCRLTRFPVCGDGVDDILGILDVRDYFRLPSIDRETVMNTAVRPAWFVPQTVTANVLLQNMRSGGHSFAVVLDEYGGVFGIVTMSDLVQCLVGDLGDDGIPAREHEDIAAQPDGSWLIQGAAALDDVEKALNVSLDADDEYDTFGGLVFGTLGRVPADGETPALALCGLDVRVLQVESRHMRLAQVRLLPQPEAAPGEKEATARSARSEKETSARASKSERESSTRSTKSEKDASSRANKGEKDASSRTGKTEKKAKA